MENPANPLTGSGDEDRAQQLATVRFWGNFELRNLVGRGSFGEVYRAWDPRLQREVGLKILLSRSLQADAPFDEVLREARALAAVRHPNILPVYGVDRHDGRVGFWTDFVRGKTLAALVREQGPFGYREAALIGLDVCKPLSAVHRAGLLHRDIKAENVMREEGGRILLMDFGLSALAGHRPEFAGTPRYMAPELWQRGGASVASDIYAVGVLLFYLVTGHYPTEQPDSMPLPGTSVAATDWAADAPTATHAMTPASMAPSVAASGSRLLFDHRPDLPEGFVRMVETAMHPDPLKRFASAGAMLSALTEILGTSSVENVPAIKQAQRAKRRIVWVSGLVLAAILIGIGAVFYLGSGGRFLDHRGQAVSQGVSNNLNDEFLKADALLQRYDRKKNVTDAINLLNKVLAQDPNFALAQAGLGQAYFLQYRATREAGLLDRARAACNRAIAIDGSLAKPYVTLARIDAMSGHTDLAMQEAQKALSLDPRSAEAYGAQAEVFDDQGRSADAMAAVQKAIDLAPDDWRWPVLLGNDYFNSGKLQDAATQYRKGAAIAQDNALALYDLGLVSLQLEQFAEAQTYLEKAVQIDPNFSGYSALAEVFSSQGKYQEAVEASRKAVALDPTNYVAWGNLGSAYLWIPGDHGQAVEAYRKAIQLAEIAHKETPQDPLLLAELGGYYAFVGHADRSLPLLRQAVMLAPDNPDILFLAGDGYEILHRRSEAIPLIAKSIGLGFHAYQLQRSPELASLRADPNFQKALQSAPGKH